MLTSFDQDILQASLNVNLMIILPYNGSFYLYVVYMFFEQLKPLQGQAPDLFLSYPRVIAFQPTRLLIICNTCNSML